MAKMHLLTSIAIILVIDMADSLTCSDNYDPVCGSDNKTYRNSCYALMEFWPDKMPENFVSCEGPCPCDDDEHQSWEPAEDGNIEMDNDFQYIVNDLKT